MRLKLRQVLAVASLIFITSGVTSAQESLVLSVSPVRLELEAEKGQTLSREITLSNAGAQTVVLTASSQDFVADGADGKPRFVPEAQSAWSMSGWIITDPARVTLEPGGQTKVKMIINVPEDAEPGGHYAAVLFSSVSSSGGATAVVAKVGTLVLLKVAGEITEAATVLLTSPRISNGGPVEFKLVFKNEGNVHTKPAGEIMVSRLFGKEVAKLATGGENVLAKSSRAFITNWSSVPYGVFVARANINFALDKAVSSREFIFFVLPWKLILAGLLVFAAGAGMSRLTSRGKRGKDSGTPA